MQLYTSRKRKVLKSSKWWKHLEDKLYHSRDIKVSDTILASGRSLWSVSVVPRDLFTGINMADQTQGWAVHEGIEQVI